MAMSNRERQANWRARLKEKASSSCATALRERARSLMTDEWLSEDGEDSAGRELSRAARDSILAMTDGELLDLWDRVIDEAHRAEFLRLSKAARRRGRRKSLVTESGGAAA